MPPVEIEEPPDETPGISDARDDVFQVGRSLLWTGDPVLDVKFLFQPPEVTTPTSTRKQPEIVVPPDEQLPTSEMSETAICGYDGVEYVRTEGHKCIAGVLPGTVVRLSDEEWAIVLQTSVDSVIYFDIPKNAVEVREASPKEFQQRFL